MVCRRSLELGLSRGQLAQRRRSDRRARRALERIGPDGGSWGVWPVQALNGIGAGLQSVAVPALVARPMQGTGRVNVAQGALMTVQGFRSLLRLF